MISSKTIANFSCLRHRSHRKCIAKYLASDIGKNSQYLCPQRCSQVWNRWFIFYAWSYKIIKNLKNIIQLFFIKNIYKFGNQIGVFLDKRREIWVKIILHHINHKRKSSSFEEIYVYTKPSHHIYYMGQQTIKILSSPTIFPLVLLHCMDIG